MNGQKSHFTSYLAVFACFAFMWNCAFYAAALAFLCFGLLGVGATDKILRANGYGERWTLSFGTCFLVSLPPCYFLIYFVSAGAGITVMETKFIGIMVMAVALIFWMIPVVCEVFACIVWHEVLGFNREQNMVQQSQHYNSENFDVVQEINSDVSNSYVPLKPRP